MSADTEEDWGDYKNYVEKLAIVEDRSFPLAIGGAGIADLIEPMVQEVIERATEQKPATVADLTKLIKSAIDVVYKTDLPWLAVKRQERTPEFLIGAKPTAEDYCIFRIKGRRVYTVKNMAIIGYGTPVNFALLKRMYRDNLPMQQAVMLAAYLVSQSKKLDEGVGGETQVVIVRDNGSWVDDPSYIRQSELFISQFLQLIDELFLNCIDSSIPPDSVLPEKLEEFAGKVKELRSNVLRYAAAHTVNRTFRDPTYRGDPYSKVFPGATTTVMGDGTVQVKEDTKEEIDKRRRFLEAASLPENLEANERFSRLLQGRQILYIDMNARISNQNSGSI